MFKNGDAGDPMPWAAAVFLAGLLVAAGFFLIWLGRRASQGVLSRNWVVGIRTRNTLASDENWEAAHRAAGGTIAAAGLGPLMVGPILLLRPSNAVGAILILAAIAWMLGGVVIGGLKSRRAIESATGDRGVIRGNLA